MSYAQHNDEEIIDGFFGKDFVGRFLDIGAFDGESMSNTRALALRGWSGTVVEPAPGPFQKLYALYKDNPEIAIVNAAVAANSGLCRFWPDTSEHKYGSTINVDWAAASHIKGAVPYLIHAVGIREIVPNPQDYDFVTIDAEGMDYEILGFGRWDGVKLLCVEHTACPNVTAALAWHGFKEHARTPTNIYAAR